MDLAEKQKKEKEKIPFSTAMPTHYCRVYAVYKLMIHSTLLMSEQHSSALHLCTLTRLTNKTNPEKGNMSISFYSRKVNKKNNVSSLITT